MPYKFNPFTGELDYYETIPNVLIYQGAIAVASDFPTAAAVQTGWVYAITANVTDNNPAKTNTGLSFITGDEIVWNGTTWDNIGPVASGFEKTSNKVTSISSGSTDVQYPSAKLLYDQLGNKQAAFNKTIQSGASYAASMWNLIIYNRASAATVNLPAATGSGNMIIVKSVNTGPVTITPNSTDTIDGETSQVLYAYESITLVDYATGLWIAL